MQHHRVFKSILIGLCLVLLVAGGLIAIVGSGGGGGDSRTPQGAIQTFLNSAISCIGGGTNAQVTIGGQVMNASRGGTSGCVFLAPGTYSATVRITGTGCPTLVFTNISITITDLATTRFSLNRLEFLGGGRYRLFFNRSQSTPGACNPKLEGEMDLQGEDLEEFTVDSEPVVEASASDWS